MPSSHYSWRRVMESVDLSAKSCTLNHAIALMQHIGWFIRMTVCIVGEIL